MARFRIDSTFALESRNLFVLSGEIVDGVIQRGMLIHIPFNSQVTMTAPVHSIEFIDGADGANTGLTVQVQDADDLEIWRGLNLGNEIVEVRADAV